MRLFVAVEIDPAVTQALSEFSAALRRKAQALAPAARIGWVRPEQLHVTARFIGEVSDSKAAAIAGALLQEVAVDPFDLFVQGAGAFPERGAPRVLWAGIAAGVEGLTAVEADVSDRLTACGLAREDRPYRPHVTLARVREPAGLRSSALFEALADRASARPGSTRLHCFRAARRRKARSTRRCIGPRCATPMNEVAVVAFGYLAGSIPFAFLLARRRGVDLRRAGSGNIGAANVLRTSGVPDAVLAMCLDAAKGSVAVLVAQRLSAEPATPVAGGLAAIIGHIYPVWLGFRGGKGVATAGGVFVVLDAGRGRHRGGRLRARRLGDTLYLGRFDGRGGHAGGDDRRHGRARRGDRGDRVPAAIIIHRHRGNLARLLAGTERRVGQRL